MNINIKKIIKWAVFIIILALIAYGAYVLYHYALNYALIKVRQTATKGVVDAVNPLKLPGRLFK